SQDSTNALEKRGQAPSGQGKVKEVCRKEARTYRSIYPLKQPIFYSLSNNRGLDRTPAGQHSRTLGYAFSCLGIFWFRTVAFMSALFRTYSTVPASRKPDSPASARASLIPFTNIRGAVSGVTYPASVDRLSALLIARSTSLL